MKILIQIFFHNFVTKTKSKKHVLGRQYSVPVGSENKTILEMFRDRYSNFMKKFEKLSVWSSEHLNYSEKSKKFKFKKKIGQRPIFDYSAKCDVIFFFTIKYFWQKLRWVSVGVSVFAWFGVDL